MPISRKRRTAKVLEILGEFLTNVAYFRAAKNDDGSEWIREDARFWKTATNNNVIALMLHWHKIFGEWNGEHHWRTVITNLDEFRAHLYKDISAEDFGEYIDQWAENRNQWIAHQDTFDRVDIPMFDNAISAGKILHGYLVQVELPLLNDPAGDPADFDELYQSSFDEARAIYANGD